MYRRLCSSSRLLPRAAALATLRPASSPAEPPKQGETDPAASEPTAEAPPTTAPSPPPPTSVPKFNFPTGEVLHAVKSGDFSKVQSQATKLMQGSWKEEYSIPAACVVVFIITWYWIAWTRRSTRRRCAILEASLQKEAEQTVEMVKNVTGKWKLELAKSNDRMLDVIDKNSMLTGDIDRMTTALRSCSIRPTPSVSSPPKIKPEAPSAAAE